MIPKALTASLLLAGAFYAKSAAAQVTAANCSSSQYFVDGTDDSNATCADFSSPEQKVAGDLSATLNSGNTAWMLSATALVMIMTPGVGFFYAGLAGTKSATNTIMMSMVSMAVVSVQWLLFGYSFSFGPGNAGFGSFKWGGLKDVGGVPSGVYGGQVPHVIFAAFQTQFAMITPALISGGIVGRMKFSSFIIYVILWTTFVYDSLAHWVWSLTLSPNDTGDWVAGALGWLGKYGALDFAGGTVIHISSGFSALVAALIVGKRYNHGEPVKPHNVPLVMIGATLLWFGWFGFNAGSQGAADGIAATAFINTHMAASAGFLTWMAIDTVVEKTQNPCGAASGAIAGLVAITPACGYVYPWASLLFGIFGSIFGYAAVHLKNYLRFDDTLDSFAIHGVVGVVGAIMTGLFATSDVNPNITGGAFYGNPEQLWFQISAVLTAIGMSTVGTFIILMLLKHTIGIRVTEEKELLGMDASYHGGDAYHHGAVPNSGDKSTPKTNFTAASLDA